MEKIPAAVIGASGFTGLELLKILLNHPRFEIAFLGTSEGGSDIGEIHKPLKDILRIQTQKSDPEAIAKAAKIAFLALPHKAAMKFVKPLLRLGVKVIDLSADYRLKKDTYEETYGAAHEDSENLTRAVYGLNELVGIEAIKNADLIANPGCYPTASILAALPFLPFMDKNSAVIIDAKSGVSGAGKQCVERTHFVTDNENFFAYSPITHRHAPEIEEKLSIAADHKLDIVFVPQLLPITRGMIASVYIKLAEMIDDPARIARDFYAGNKFTRVRDEPAHIKWVAGTHFCDLSVMQKSGTLFIQTAIDNLLRGAASAAVANANVMSGFDIGLGLPVIAYAP